MDDLRIVAAHLAARMVDADMLAGVKGRPADNAAKIYFDVYDALIVAHRKRQESQQAKDDKG